MGNWILKPQACGTLQQVQCYNFIVFKGFFLLEEFLGNRQNTLLSYSPHTKGGYVMEVLKVSAQSNPKSVAGALAAVLRERGSAEVQAVGAGAVNQAIKAIAVARGFVAPNGIDLVTIPAFAEISIDGEERTAIRFIVEPR